MSWLACVSLGAFADVPPVTGPAPTLPAPGQASAPAAVTPEATPADEIQEIVITAPEARYVSPTRRDRIGRIWAPVYINNQGPFRLVLDTGASRSCVIQERPPP